MDTSNYRQYQAEQDLLKCGLSLDSINAIRSTSVVDHDGTQVVVQNSDLTKFQNENSSVTPTDSQNDYSSLVQQLAQQQRMFSRYKQFSEERLTSVEKQLSRALEVLKEVSAQMQTMKSNAHARAQVPQSHAVVSPTPSSNEGAVSEIGAKEVTSAPSNRPIDRNNVAPESVQIEKIFYCGHK